MPQVVPQAYSLLLLLLALLPQAYSLLAYSLHFPAEPVEVLPSFLLLLLILSNPLLYFYFQSPLYIKPLFFINSRFL